VRLICTIWGQQRLTGKSAREISKKASKIEELSEKNISLNEEVASLAKKNANLNEELRNYVSGGDSYCYIKTYFEVGHNDNSVAFSLEHIGKYPLYDVDVVIYDRTKRSELMKKLGFHKEMKAGEWAEIQKTRDFFGEFEKIRQESILIKHHFPVIFFLKSKVIPIILLKQKDSFLSPKKSKSYHFLPQESESLSLNRQTKASTSQKLLKRRKGHEKEDFDNRCFFGLGIHFFGFSFSVCRTL